MSSDFESARNRSHGELDRPSFVAALKASGALQFGTFTLASGKTSSYYVDIKKAITRPDLLRRIAKAMAPYARGASRLAGVELGAVVEDCVCVVDREEGGAILLAEIGVRLHALLRASELTGS